MKKVRVGSRLTRRYDAARTPLDRLLDGNDLVCLSLVALKQTRVTLDPFTLAQSIEQKLERFWTLTNQRLSPKSTPSLR
jgi:hypothetical protein